MNTLIYRKEYRQIILDSCKELGISKDDISVIYVEGMLIDAISKYCWNESTESLYVLFMYNSAKFTKEVFDLELYVLDNKIEQIITPMVDADIIKWKERCNNELK